MMNRLYTFMVAGAAAGMAGVAADTVLPEEIRVFEGKARIVRAAEDTTNYRAMYEIDEIVVQEDSIPFIEIIRKAQAGERRKYEGLATLAFNESFKVTARYGGREPKARCTESIRRAFYRHPGQWAAFTLKRDSYEIDPDGSRKPWNEEEARVRAGRSREGRDLTEIPFYLERLDKFSFHRENALFNPETFELLYEVSFKPLSDFEVLPSGRLWLLTPAYQIVREEFELKNLPFPWILKGVDLLTREWQPVGDRWMVSRITGRVNLGLGFLGVPSSVEFVHNFDHYEFNPDLDREVFRKGGR